MLNMRPSFDFLLSFVLPTTHRTQRPASYPNDFIRQQIPRQRMRDEQHRHFALELGSICRLLTVSRPATYSKASGLNLVMGN